MREYSGKSVLVAGADASGLAAAALLQEAGAHVTIWDGSGAVDPRQPGLQGARLVTGEADVLSCSYEVAVLGSQTSKLEGLIQKLIAAGIPVISDLELAFRAARCLAVAVAGTNGKTTTAEMIESMTRQAGRRTLRGGGSGTPFCALADQSRELDFIIAEVNSFQLEAIVEFKPSVAVVLNLKPDHMDRYDRLSNYARAIGRVFENQESFAWAIIQSEALALLRLHGVSIPSKIITFSSQNKRADLYLDRSLIISQIEDWSGPILDLDQCQLRGPHQAENMMAALAVGRVLRIPLEEMLLPLRNHAGGPHRCEKIAVHGGITFVNDSKAMNIDAVQKAIEAMPQGSQGEPNVILIAGGKDKGLDFHDLGPLLGRRVKAVYLIGEAREKLRAAWSLFTPCTPLDSLLEAVMAAAQSASAGDVVLLSPGCSSLDMFHSYQDRGEIFRCAVAKWLETQPPEPPAESQSTAPKRHLDH